MSLFRSIVFSAAVAGLVVGTAVTVAQQFGTVPLIQKAETYEHAAQAAARNTPGTTAVHQHAGHDHGMAAWEPRDGLERNSFTAAANILTATGFALVLAGIYALRGRPVSWHEGLLWGLGGFIVFTATPGSSGSRPNSRASRPRQWQHVRSGGSQRRPRRRRDSVFWCFGGPRGRQFSVSA